MCNRLRIFYHGVLGWSGAVDHLVSEQAVAELLQANEAVLLLFGGRQCGVCQAIKPQLEQLAAKEFPELAMGYIDCQDVAGTPLCAARGIFSLPVVQLWFQGQRFLEFARVFSIGDIREALARPYAALKS